jgi:RNA polymerase subunit RPABC4/transcription elongation factor Spt4
MSSLDAYDGKVIMLSSKNCPACDELKRRMRSSPEVRDSLVVLDVEDSQLAKDIAEVMGADRVPFLVSVHRKDERTFVLCSVDTDECIEIERAN